MTQITATIITLNEEDRIARAIASLACCDEVLVVDSGSTDRTTEIAEAHGAVVVRLAWQGYARQKNAAADLAQNDWIFSIDADECLSAELAAEISLWKKRSANCNGMSMPRRAFYLGKWIEHSGWYPDRKLRLYHRRQGQWDGDYVHEALHVTHPLGRFSGDLLHFPYRNLADHEKRVDRYTRLAAEAARKVERHGNFLKLVFAPPAAFLKAFVFKLGFLDGWRGARISYMAARYVFARELLILRQSSRP